MTLINKKLEWKNLKDEFCPKCYSEISNNDGSLRVFCTSCDFSISKIRYNEILEDMEKEEAGNDADYA